MKANALLLLLLGTACAGPGTGAEGDLVLHTRKRVEGDGGVQSVDGLTRWGPRRTAIVVVDMWDDHWCRGAARRVAELAVPLNELLEDLRERGVFVIHAPSSVVDFYDGTPARARAQEAPHAETPVPLSSAERWGTNWCWPDPEREPPLPIDDSDMGCDCEPECELRDPWTRQIDRLRIDPADALTDDGQETWNLLQERGIDHVLLCGVHLNMCVLGRPVGIRQLVLLGKDVLLIRDMTDSMYDRDQRPFVDHFSGTELVVEHVERSWCPTILSTDLTGRPAFRFAEDPR